MDGEMMRRREKDEDAAPVEADLSDREERLMRKGPGTRPKIGARNSTQSSM